MKNSIEVMFSEKKMRKIYAVRTVAHEFEPYTLLFADFVFNISHIFLEWNNGSCYTAKLEENFLSKPWNHYILDEFQDCQKTYKFKLGCLKRTRTPTKLFIVV